MVSFCLISLIPISRRPAGFLRPGRQSRPAFHRRRIEAPRQTIRLPERRLSRPARQSESSMPPTEQGSGLHQDELYAGARSDSANKVLVSRALKDHHNQVLDVLPEDFATSLRFSSIGRSRSMRPAALGRLPVSPCTYPSMKETPFFSYGRTESAQAPQHVSTFQRIHRDIHSRSSARSNSRLCTA